MTNSFQKLGENLNVMNDNIMSLVHWPEGELSEDISEQPDVNEVNEASEKHSNDEQNADESATGQAEPPSRWKQMTSDKVILDMVKGCHITFTHNQFPLQLRPF